MICLLFTVSLLGGNRASPLYRSLKIKLNPLSKLSKWQSWDVLPHLLVPSAVLFPIQPTLGLIRPLSWVQGLLSHLCLPLWTRITRREPGQRPGKEQKVVGEEPGWVKPVVTLLVRAGPSQPLGPEACPDSGEFRRTVIRRIVVGLLSFTWDITGYKYLNQSDTHCFAIIWLKYIFTQVQSTRKTMTCHQPAPFYSLRCAVTDIAVFGGAGGRESRGQGPQGLLCCEPHLGCWWSSHMGRWGRPSLLSLEGRSGKTPRDFMVDVT